MTDLKVKTQDLQKLNIRFLYYFKLGITRKEAINAFKFLSLII